MSGANVPYHLRPHKAVDRRIFLDLLSRIERWRPLTDYVYLSMGAYPLEDHKLIHRSLGISRLVAFDLDDAIVARQKFNKPISSCHCLTKKSGELIDEIDLLLGDCGFTDPAGLIVWLDYTDPKKIGNQIREFETLLNKLSAGDVVRITVNAHPHELIERAFEPQTLAEVKREHQFSALKNRIGDYLPSWASADHMTVDELPKVIAESFSKAALAAFPVSGANTFRPLSLVRYADGLQMLSLTGVVAPRADEGTMLQRLHLDTWPFASHTWSEIHSLLVPDLTTRERLFLEREVLNKTADEIVAELGFESASGMKISAFIENYRNYYRFYPTLLSAEL